MYMWKLIVWSGRLGRGKGAEREGERIVEGRGTGWKGGEERVEGRRGEGGGEGRGAGKGMRGEKWRGEEKGGEMDIELTPERVRWMSNCDEEPDEQFLRPTLHWIPVSLRTLRI